MAYETLLQERRRALHARIVEALEALAGERAAEQVERLAHHALPGRCGTRPWRTAGGREKAMARSAHREAVGYFEQALSPAASAGAARDTREQAIDLRFALRAALRPLGDVGRILAVLREAETLAAALDDPRRLGQVSRSVKPFHLMGAYDQAIPAAQRALALATAGGDVGLHALANQYLGLAYQAQGDYRRAIDCLGQTVASLEGARCYERFDAGDPARCELPCLASPRAMPSWARSPRAEPSGKRAADCRGGCSPREPHVCLLGARSAVPPPRRPIQHSPRLERAVDICQEADLPAYFPGWLRPWARRIPWWARRRRHAAAHAGDGTDQGNGNRALQLCGLSLGEAHLLAGDLEEAHALAERAGARPCAPGTRPPGVCPAPPRRDCGTVRASGERSGQITRQALALAEELGMRPLVAHCHLGLGKLYTSSDAAPRPALICPLPSSCTEPWR